MEFFFALPFGDGKTSRVSRRTVRILWDGAWRCLKRDRMRVEGRDGLKTREGRTEERGNERGGGKRELYGFDTREIMQGPLAQRQSI